ncbi:hypothetical protein AOLI_G00021220 [Acnodon oligacanthus]
METVDSPESAKEKNPTFVPYDCPTIEQLEDILHGGQLSCNHVDEVWPNLFLGDMYMSHDRYGLWRLGVTHVLNAAHGKMCCKGSDDFYGTTVKYYGVAANDLPTFDISPFFYPSAQYVHQALSTAGAKIFVHCAVGVSRSAALVLAYLMIYHNYTLVDAILKVKEKRWIFPNRGFLKQLHTQCEHFPSVLCLCHGLQSRPHRSNTPSPDRLSRAPVRADHPASLADAELSLGPLKKFASLLCFFLLAALLDRRMTNQKNKHGLAEIKALENLLDTCKLELNAVDEVWPNLFIGNVAIAQNRTTLKKLGITHILNVAHSKQGSIGDQSYYGEELVYYGIPAEDSSKFDLSVHFRPASDFIHKALKKKNGKVLVHCIMGVSRSSTLVLAYLMLRHRLTLRSAIQKVVQRRAIYPNRNFLSLLLELDTQLQRKRMLCPIL